jgi:hypothetical protein
MEGVIIVIPSKKLLAMRTDAAKQQVSRWPRNPTLSTGVLLISKIYFALLNLEKGSANMDPKKEKSGSAIIKSGLEIRI